MGKDISDAITRVEKEISEAREKGWNVLIPQQRIEGLAEYHMPVLERVDLNTDTTDQSCDIYMQTYSSDVTKARYAVHHRGLIKLSVSVGMVWDGVNSCRTDNGSDKGYVSFRAIGGLKKPDGSYVMAKAEYDLDFEVTEMELRDLYTKKVKESQGSKYVKTEQWAEECIRRDLLQKRKHKLKLAESGAKDRVIRELLGVKSTYTLAEIKQPFLVLRIVVRPDYSDEQVKRLMLANAMASMNGIYGSQMPALPASTYPVVDIDPEDPTTETPPTAACTTAPPAAPPPEAKKEEPPKAQLIPIDEFKALPDIAEKRKVINRAAGIVKWDVSKLTGGKDLDKMSTPIVEGIYSTLYGIWENAANG